MSSKTTALNNLLQAVKRLPADKHKVYSSFRDIQVERLENSIKSSAESKLPSVEQIERDVSATQRITSDSNKRKFPLSEKMLAPQGMPNYYIRITREADVQQQKKESFVTSFREAALGWFK